MNDTRSRSGSGRPLSPALLDLARAGAASPVRPLLPPSIRAASLVALGLSIATVAVLARGIRPDAGALGALVVSGPALGYAAVGALLVALAMREGVPGEGAAARLRVASMLLAPAALFVGAEWLARGAGSRATGLGPLSCFPRAVVLALPAAGAAAWLLSRAYPLRSVFAWTAGALGSALLADAVMHLTCPAASRPHTLLVHGGAVGTVAAVGAGVGWLRSRRRTRATL